MGKADEKEVAVKRSLGGAKYFIAQSIDHCDLVVYAVNTGHYGIRYVPIKMNVIFQETYENIN